MIVDCHVHIAPDKIARAIEEVIAKRFGLQGSFMVGRVKETMQRLGIDVSVVFNVAERPDLVQKANDFVISLAGDRQLVSIGTIHPEMPHPEDEVQRMRAGGVKGIKFHALIQLFGADHPGLDPVYEAMGDDMVAYFHAGQDPHDPTVPVLNSPRAIGQVKQRFPKLKIVAAHLGGLHMLEEAREHIIGRDIYVDTSYSAINLDPGQVVKLIRDHGTDHVLFGSDSPVEPVEPQLRWAQTLAVSDDVREQMLGQNAKVLFGIN